MNTAPFPPTKVGRVAHLLGAETLHLEYPTQVVFELGHRRGQRRRPHRNRRAQRRRQVQSAGPAHRANPARFRPGDAPQRRARRRPRPGRHPRRHQHRRSGTRRRQGRPRMGRRPRDPRRRRRPGVRHRLGCADLDAVGRATTPGAVGSVADGRLGRHRPRRTHQPPRHRGHHLAGRASEGDAGRATPAGCSW